MFMPCGGVPAERTCHVSFKLACLGTGARQAGEQHTTTTVLLPGYLWPRRTALASPKDLPSSIPMLWCEVGSERRGAFTLLGCSGKVKIIP